MVLKKSGTNLCTINTSGGPTQHAERVWEMDIVKEEGLKFRENSRLSKADFWRGEAMETQENGYAGKNQKENHSARPERGAQYTN